MRVVLLLSADGLTWTAPDLRQEERSGLPSNALVFDGAPNSPVGTAPGIITAEPTRTRHDQVGQPQVVRLEDGRWRMYYRHHQHGWGRVPYLYTIAESDDGARWRVPDYEKPAQSGTFQDMEELIGDLQEFYQTRGEERMIPWEEWDRQIGVDSDTGKLDFLVREAKEDGASGTIDDL